MPPIHPALVHYPIALTTFSFVADLLGYVRNSASLRAAGFWSLVGAAVISILTVTTGYYDMNRASLGETHDYVDVHMNIGWVLLAAVVAVALWRWSLFAKAERSVGRGYLVAAFLALGLTLFQGWFGGEMVYSHGAGVAEAGKGMEPPGTSYKRLDKVMGLLGKGNKLDGEPAKKSGDGDGDHSH